MSADLSVLATGQRNIEARTTARSEARPVPAPVQKPAPEQDIAGADARKAVAAANDQLLLINSELTFQLDDETGRIIVKLIDRNTREVLRQMPTKEALAIARALAEGIGSGKIVKANA